MPPRNWNLLGAGTTARFESPEYVTVVHGHRWRGLSPADAAWAGYTIRQAGEAQQRTMLASNRLDRLPRATTGGPSTTGIDWNKKLAGLRPTQLPIHIPYSGPGTLGLRPTHATTIGKSIWEQVQRQKQIQARRLGSCYGTTVNRMKAGWQQAYGIPLLAGRTQEEQLVFDAIAGTRYSTYPRLWRTKVPSKLKYTGVAGALAYFGKATVVGTDAVWQGELEPGAPLQIWYAKPGYPPGHSAVLERYIRDKNGKVVGLVYSDQWSDYKLLLRSQKGDLLAPKIYGAKFR